MAQTSAMMQEVMTLLNLQDERILRAVWLQLDRLAHLPTLPYPQGLQLAQIRGQGSKIPSFCGLCGLEQTDPIGYLEALQAPHWQDLARQQNLW